MIHRVSIETTHGYVRGAKAPGVLWVRIFIDDVIVIEVQGERRDVGEAVAAAMRSWAWRLAP